MHKPLISTLIASAIHVTALGAQAQTPAMRGHLEPASTSTKTGGEQGQAAFASIAEVVATLQADPATDWGKVNIDALRAHLVDMDNVLLRSRVTTVPVEGGARFAIRGDGAAAGSIRRMAASHASMTDGEAGLHVAVTSTADGADMTVTGDRSGQEAKIKALGFYGLLTGGVHHQPHHLMMAKGTMQH